MNNIADVNVLLFQRYIEVIESAEAGTAMDPFSEDPRLSLKNLKWMCRVGIEQAKTMTVDKASRWLGFVQGCLASRRLLLVDEEREFTRPLFHEVYKSSADGTPETLVREE